jgi:hypothetical protein
MSKRKSGSLSPSILGSDTSSLKGRLVLLTDEGDEGVFYDFVGQVTIGRYYSYVEFLL